MGIKDRIVRAVVVHPKEVTAALVLAASAGAIIVNALAFQTARHPAPMFGPRLQRADVPAPLPPSRPVAPSSLAVAPPQRSPVRETVSEPIRTGDVFPPAPARPTLPVAPAKPPTGRDPIGDLIRSGEPQMAPSAVSRSERLVTAGQRALVKLGYGPLKADGLVGPGTRQALERFERDHRLPVTGELGPRTARELAAQAGMPIE